MKPLSYLALAALSCLTLSNSCHKQEGDSPCPMQVEVGVDPGYRPCVPGSRAETQLFVVNSQAEYQAAFPCSSFVPSAASLADSTLLVGYQPYANCGHVKSQRFFRTCETGTYTYQVVIEAGACAAAMPVTSAWRVPKLPAGARVVLDMQ